MESIIRYCQVVQSEKLSLATANAPYAVVIRFDAIFIIISVISLVRRLSTANTSFYIK